MTDHSGCEDYFGSYDGGVGALEAEGSDAIVAHGFEAGGHRGMFLVTNPASQVGAFALVPQVVDAVGLAH